MLTQVKRKYYLINERGIQEKTLKCSKNVFKQDKCGTPFLLGKKLDFKIKNYQ